MAYGNAVMKFRQAVRLLATGAGPIHERLIVAGREILHISPESDLDRNGPTGDLAERVIALMNRLTLTRSGADGAVGATVNQMSLDAAVDVAREIVSLAYELAFARDM